MSKYRNNLPQLSNQRFLSDGGLETTLIFHDGIDLPGFASFVLMDKESDREKIKEYYLKYVNIARENKVGFILESPTWRANRDWAEKIDYPLHNLEQANIESIKLLAELRDEYETEISRMPISGCIGPRGDGYVVGEKMTIEEAEQYHSEQIETFKITEADLVTAFTISYSEEAIGIVQAAQKSGIPSVIGFTVETDGKLPSGQTLKSVIEEVDKATNNGPAYYMINCAHPEHFKDVLTTDENWTQRIRAIRANASCKSHEELDESTELDDGNPEQFGADFKALVSSLKHLNVFGGCCGTDHRHIESICKVALA